MNVISHADSLAVNLGPAMATLLIGVIAALASARLIAIKTKSWGQWRNFYAVPLVLMGFMTGLFCFWFGSIWICHALGLVAGQDGESGSFPWGMIAPWFWVLGAVHFMDWLNTRKACALPNH